MPITRKFACGGDVLVMREKRNKEKLRHYYEKYITQGEIDANVHPWVAASWQRSRALAVPNRNITALPRLSPLELACRQEQHRPVIECLDRLYDALKGHFDVYNLNLLLLDAECYILRSYALPFFHPTLGAEEGLRVQERDLGTSSIALARQHLVPFLMFGPEMWVEEYQHGDACSAPVMVEGKLRNIVSLAAVEMQELPYSAIYALLVSIQQGLENFLTIKEALDRYTGNSGGTERQEDAVGAARAAGRDGDWRTNRELFWAYWREEQGNITRLAQRLGVSRMTLYRYRKKFRGC